MVKTFFLKKFTHPSTKSRLLFEYEKKMEEKEYYVDFESFNITAKSEQEAREKAIERIGEGEIPDIVNIELN